MKKILICLFTIPVALSCFCQVDMPKNAQGNYEYTGVVNVDSASADKLYSNAKLFIVDAFKSAKDVTQLSDDNSKTVVGEGSQRIYYTGFMNSQLEEYYKFKFSIQCKDGRYKYTVTNFQFWYAHGTSQLEDEKRLSHYVTKKMRSELFAQLSKDMNSMISLLKRTMASQTASTKDW